MNQTYIHVQIYSWQKIILASNILNIKNEPRALVIISTNTLDCNFREVSSNHIAWVPYCTAEHHAEYHAKDRETRNSNTNNSNELELNTDYGFNFVDAILVAWKLLWTRGLDLFRAFFSTALKRWVEGNESSVSPSPVPKVIAVGLLIHALYVSYSYILAYKCKHSSCYFSSEYHQQTGKKRSEHTLWLTHGSTAPEETHSHH